MENEDRGAVERHATRTRSASGTSAPGERRAIMESSAERCRGGGEGSRLAPRGHGGGGARQPPPPSRLRKTRDDGAEHAVAASPPPRRKKRRRAALALASGIAGVLALLSSSSSGEAAVEVAAQSSSFAYDGVTGARRALHAAVPEARDGGADERIVELPPGQGEDLDLVPGLWSPEAQLSTLPPLPRQTTRRRDLVPADDAHTADDDQTTRQLQSSSSSSTLELRTPLDGSNGSFGTMFDVSSTGPSASPVLVKTLALHVNVVSSSCRVKIHTKDGTHRGFESDVSAWTLVFDGDVQCAGFQVPTVIPAALFSGIDSIAAGLTGGVDGDDSVLRIGSGGVRGFYVHLSEPNLRYTNGKEAAELTQADRNVYVRAGTGMGGYFELPYSPRHWNGIVYYEVVEFDASGNTNALDPALLEAGCAGDLMTTFQDTIGSYGSMFNLRVPATLPPPDALSGRGGSSDPIPNPGILLTGMDIYTDVTTPVEFEVYTREGTFTDALSDITKWTLIAAGTTLGSGSFIGTTIPPALWFGTMRLEAGALRSFYATLTRPDMRYTDTNLKVGDVFVGSDDGALQIEVGVGVAEYPLGKTFYGPRVWNGRVRYRTLGSDAACRATPAPTPAPVTVPQPTVAEVVVSAPDPTPQPVTPSPTYAPAIPRFRTLDVELPYLVEHPAYLGRGQLFKEVDGIVQVTVERAMSTDDPTLQRYVAVFGLWLEGVQSALGAGNGGSSCVPQDQSKLCTPVTVDLSLSHAAELESEAVRYALLRLVDGIALALNASPQLLVRYVGSRPLTSSKVITLTGVPAEEMGIEETDYFRDAAREFLNEEFASSNLGGGGQDGGVQVLAVEVVGQEVLLPNVGGGSSSVAGDPQGGNRRRLFPKILRPFDLLLLWGKKKRNRDLQVSSAAAVDVSTTVTGEHRPPPHVKFDELVEDSIDRGGERFKEKLKKGGKKGNNKDTGAGSNYFQGVDGASARDMPTVAPTPGPTTAPSIAAEPEVVPAAASGAEQPDGGLFGSVTGILIIVVAAIALVGLALVAYLLHRKKKKKKQAQDALGANVVKTYSDANMGGGEKGNQWGKANSHSTESWKKNSDAADPYSKTHHPANRQDPWGQDERAPPTKGIYDDPYGEEDEDDYQDEAPGVVLDAEVYDDPYQPRKKNGGGGGGGQFDEVSAISGTNTLSTKQTMFSKSSARSARPGLGPGALQMRDNVRDNMIKEEEYSVSSKGSRMSARGDGRGRSQASRGAHGYPDSGGNRGGGGGGFQRQQQQFQQPPSDDFDTGTISSVGQQMRLDMMMRQQQRQQQQEQGSLGSRRSARSLPAGGRAAVRRGLQSSEDDYLARARRKAAQANGGADGGGSVVSSASNPHGAAAHRYPPRRGTRGGGGGGPTSPGGGGSARFNDTGSLRSSSSGGYNSSGSGSRGGGLPRYAHHSLAGAGEVSRGSSLDGANGNDMHSRRSQG